MKKVTFCLMTCGELTESECLAAIAPFRDQIVFTEVRKVYPQIKALNQMIDSIGTEYFVPLDADIVLNCNAWERIKAAISKHTDNPNWHSILFPLYDTLTERRILALKVLRTRVMRKHPFKESATPDVEHYGRLSEAGYGCVHEYLDSEPIGKHVVKGRHFCYHKYRDVYLTYRSHNRVWDSGAFVGGRNLRSLSKAHFDFFFYRWAITGNEDYLHCIAGMVDGITSSDLNKSKSLQHGEYKVDSKEAPSIYIEWYVQQPVDAAEMLF